jgi:hypothetical protein
LAGKPRFFEQSENPLPRDCSAFVPQFSEGNNGSSFSEQNWAAGSMSRLVGEVKLQTQSLKMDVGFEIPLRLDQMISVRSSDGSTDLGTLAGWLLKATLICSISDNWTN